MDKKTALARLARARAIMSELKCGQVDELCDGKVIQLYDGRSEHLLVILERDSERYAWFLEMLEAARTSTMKILELGANPYVCSYLLARSLQSELILGGHSLSTERGTRTWQVRIITPATASGIVIPLVRFNVETDRFPFDDGYFDAVICGELIEHMVSGPDHLLMEINRVMKPGGQLLLSTPNAVSMSKCIALTRGRTIACGFSRQGIYGRHHREYTLPELQDLLIGNHFAVAGARFLVLQHRREYYKPGFKGWLKWRAVASLLKLGSAQRGPLRNRGEVIVVHAVKEGGPVVYQPAFLYDGRDTIPMVPNGLAEGQPMSAALRGSGDN